MYNEIFLQKKYSMNIQNNQLTRGFVLAILAALLWGLSGTFAQFLFQQRGVNVEWMITVRMLCSGIILLVFPLVKGNKDLFGIWKNRKDVVELVLFSLIGMLTVQYTYFATIKYSNAATATVLQYLGPVIIAIFLSIKSRKSPDIWQIISIVLAVVGTFLLVTHGNINSLNISKQALYMGIASAFSLAIYTLQPMALLRKYNSSVVIGWAMVLGGLAFSFVKSPFSVEGVWDFSAYISAGFIIVFGTLVAFYAYLTAAQIIGGQKTSLLASAEPLSATIVAVLWLNVPFLLMDWIGSAFIVSTIVLLGIKK